MQKLCVFCVSVLSLCVFPRSPSLRLLIALDFLLTFIALNLIHVGLPNLKSNTI